MKDSPAAASVMLSKFLTLLGSLRRMQRKYNRVKRALGPSEQLATFVDEEEVLSQWDQLKFEAVTCPPVRYNKSRWKFYMTYQTVFPEFWKLVQILLTLPVNTAACEWGFSKMKIIQD